MDLSLIPKNTKTDESKKYVEIFRQIGREQELKSYYFQCHQKRLEDVWITFDTAASPPSKAPQDQPLVQWLPKFYDSILNMLTEEVCQLTTTITSSFLID